MRIYRELPPAARSYVRAFAARRRAVAVLRAVGTAASVLACIVLVACLADRWLRFPAWGRLTLLLFAAGAAVATLAWALVRAMRPVSFSLLAQLIESRTDAFGQRLITIASATEASAELREHLLGEIEAIASRPAENLLAPEGLTPWRTAGMAWAVVAAVITAIAITWPISSIGMPRLLARLAHPGMKLEPVTITLLEVSPRGEQVRQGDSVLVKAIASGAHATNLGSRGVEIYLSTDGRHWSHAAMNPVSLAADSARFEFLLPAIDRDLRYYVRGGDASSDEYQIKVKHVPTVAEFHLRYTYPEYTHHAPTVAQNTDGTIEALAGCEATVTIVSTEPLSSADLIVGGMRIPMSIAPTNRATDWQARVSVTQDANCSLEMTSAGGVVGHGPSPMVMRAIPDREPVVTVDQPLGELRLSPDDLVALRYHAVDDYGLRSLEAVAQLNVETPEIFPLGVPQRALRRQGEFAFNLAELNPTIGDVVTLTVRAHDSLGQMGESES